MPQCIHGSNLQAVGAWPQCVTQAHSTCIIATRAGKVQAAFLEAAKRLLPLLLTTVLKTLEDVLAPVGAGTEDTDLPQAAAGKAPGCGSLLAGPVHDVGLARCGLLEVRRGADCLPGPVCGGLHGLWEAKRAQALTTSACWLHPCLRRPCFRCAGFSQHCALCCHVTLSRLAAPVPRCMSWKQGCAWPQISPRLVKRLAAWRLPWPAC